MRPAIADDTAASAREARLRQCLSWLDSGYPSGIAERSCVAEFDLPSPFLFTCARAVRAGFADSGQRDACAFFYARESQRIGDAYIRN